MDCYEFMRWYDWASLIILMSLGGWKFVELGETFAKWLIRKIEGR